jgi:hypothetical protein
MLASSTYGNDISDLKGLHVSVTDMPSTARYRIVDEHRLPDLMFRF